MAMTFISPDGSGMGAKNKLEKKLKVPLWGI